MSLLACSTVVSERSMGKCNRFKSEILKLRRFGVEPYVLLGF